MSQSHESESWVIISDQNSMSMYKYESESSLSESVFDGIRINLFPLGLVELLFGTVWTLQKHVDVSHLQKSLTHSLGLRT